MPNTFFYTIGIAFTGGIFIRSFFDISFSAVALISVIGVALILIGKILKLSSFPFYIIGILFIVLSLGMVRMHVANEKVSPLLSYEMQDIEFVARVVREPELRATTAHFYVKLSVDNLEIDEKILVTAERFGAMRENISYGDIVLVKGTLSKPETFESNGGRVFNYPGFLKARGVTYTVRYGEITFVKSGSKTFLSKIYKSKSSFQESLEQILPMPHAGLGEGLLLGVKRALGNELEEIFRKTGIIHIVVLSGYNVMIVVEAMMLILAFFFVPRTRMIIGIGSIVLFALLVGLSATVVRASIMAGLLLIARATGRVYAILRALILAGIVMLIVNPYLLIHDPGFQLSFLATLGLILGAPYLEEKLTVFPQTFGMRKIVTATLVTQIFVLPLILYQMGLLSFVAVFVNVLVLPAVPIAMLLTFLTGIVGLFSGTLATFIGFFTYYVLGYIIGIPEFFGSFSFASIDVPRFPAWIMVMLYGVMAIVMVRIHKRKNAKDTVSIDNSYSDWTIEEEIEQEKSGDAQSASPDKSTFPFR